VIAHLTLANRLEGRVLDSGWFWLCNFFGPGEDGRIVEPGQKVQRTFDDVSSRFSASMRARLGKSVQDNLQNFAPKQVTLSALFEFDS
jgi:hypothetical protein